MKHSSKLLLTTLFFFVFGFFEAKLLAQRADFVPGVEWELFTTEKKPALKGKLLIEENEVMRISLADFPEQTFDIKYIPNEKGGFTGQILGNLVVVMQGHINAKDGDFFNITLRLRKKTDKVPSVYALVARKN